ncbi:MAG: FG-GAP repeat domain-containing protein, partial [Wenzhouxiangella sp.]
MSAQSFAVSFSDVSAASGFEPPHQADIPAGGIAVADFNGNGFPDIFVTGYTQPNRLFFNQGNGQFIEDDDINSMIAGQRCSVAAAADFDNDGWPDLYVGCLGQSNLLLRNLSGQGFENVITAALDHAATGVSPPRTDAVAWGDLTGNGYLDLYIGILPNSAQPDIDDPGNLDRIVLNNGDGSWTNISTSFNTEDKVRLARPALAVVISDLNLNGRPDIYVVNDKLQGNVLWRNEGPGCDGWCFSDIATASGTERPVFGMGIAVGDIDRSGRWDLYFSSIDEQVLLRGASVDPLSFIEDPETVLDVSGVGWGTLFADFDNDGWLDAFLALGSGSTSTELDTDRVFLNQRNGTFTSVTQGSGLDQVRATQAAARIDFNMDGRIDLVLGHWNQSPGYRLYRNDTEKTGNWIGLKLRGHGQVNRDAIGARVYVDTGSGTMQMSELRAG